MISLLKKKKKKMFVCLLIGVFRAQATTMDYIRAEGDFIKRYIVERTNKAEIRPEELSEKTEELSGIFKK